MLLRKYYMSPDGDLACDLNNEQLINVFRQKQGLLWVDVIEPSEEDRILLEDGFGLHHLVVEDCVSPETHPPKIDEFEDYLFLIVHGINHQAGSDVVDTAELALFLGHHFVISVHRLPLYSIETIQAHVDKSGRWMMNGADFLAHSLIDSLIDNVLPTIDKMSDVADAIEEAAIRSPAPETMEDILKLKRSSLRIYRVMAPQREILNRLSRDDFPQIKAEARIFYKDIYDHLIRIEDLNQAIRDMSDNALSTYLSAVANRQNDSMKVMTMVATIFLPLTLIASIYGMNFDYMPELKWHWAYFSVLGFIVIVIIVMFYIFWANRWIMWGREKVGKTVRPFTVAPEKLTWHISKLAKRPHNNGQEQV